MKFSMFLTIVLAAIPAFANQPYRGPLMTRDIGQKGENLGLISNCQLLGNNRAIKWDEVSKDIAQAFTDSKSPNNYERHTYVKFNAPEKLYVVYRPVEEKGKPPRLDKLVLFSDGGSYDVLKTDASRRLLQVITDNCGALKPQQGAKTKLGLAPEKAPDLFKSDEFAPNGEFND